MTRYTRLLDEGKPQNLEQELLQAGADLRLSEQRKVQIWEHIAKNMSPGGDMGPSHSPPTSPPSVLTPLGSGVVKLGAVIGIGALWAGAWLGGNWLGQNEADVTPPFVNSSGSVSTSSSSVPALEVASTPLLFATVGAPSSSSEKEPVRVEGPVHTRALARPEVPTEQNHPTSVDSNSTVVAPVDSAEAARQEQLNRLREEAAMVQSARQALRSGGASQALQILGQIQEKIGGRGGLQQEREALTIEALAKTGRQAEAKARAESFLKMFPTSPFASDIKIFAL